MSLGARGGDPSRLAFLKLVGAGLRIAGEVLLSAAVMHRFMPRGLASASSRPRRPLVLCHGLLGFRSLLDSRWSKTLGLPELHYYRGVVERLRAEGHTVLLPEVGRVDSIAERAQTLRRFVVAAIENPSLWNGVPRFVRVRPPSFATRAHLCAGRNAKYTSSATPWVASTAAILFRGSAAIVT
jgi:hypothetical protein